MPAGLAYGGLLEALGGEVEAIAKDLGLDGERRSFSRGAGRVAGVRSDRGASAGGDDAGVRGDAVGTGVEPPPPPPGPPPPWMASRPAGLRAFLKTFRSSTLDVDRLRSFAQPVYFALGGRSNPDYYGRMAERAREIFPDFTLDIFTERHHFDPPHRMEPERTASALRAHWARADG